MKKINSATMETVYTILCELEHNPNKVITNELGSGCHARAYGEHNEFHKIVIPGDTFETAKLQLHYLLFDLGVDCGLSDAQLKTLENI
jgi:hypothetical protein